MGTCEGIVDVLKMAQLSIK